MKAALITACLAVLIVCIVMVIWNMTGKGD